MSTLDGARRRESLMGKSFGTLYRLDESKGLTTSLGGAKELTSSVVTIEVNNAGEPLHFAPDQEVFERDLGFIPASKVTQGMSLVWAERVPLNFGNQHYPSTMYILGVMSHLYDPNFQSLSSLRFSAQERQEISRQVPEALRELGVFSKGLPYPPFSRISNTDGTIDWVQISPNFKTIFDTARNLNLVSEDFQVPEGLLSRESIIRWAVGRMTGGHVAECSVIRLLGVRTIADCYALLDTDLPFNPKNATCVSVTSVHNRDVVMPMIVFHSPFWVYPSLLEEGNTTSGVLCRRFTG